MEKYLSILNEIKNGESDNEEVIQSLDKIAAFIKAEITSEELMQDASLNHTIRVYQVINKLINHRTSRFKYYVELPATANFNTISSKAIIKTELSKLKIDEDEVIVIGPYDFQDEPIILSKNMYIEVMGDFKAYPHGVKIYPADWYQIILKYPGLINRMYYLNELENSEFKKNSPSMIEFIIGLEAKIKENIKLAKKEEKNPYSYPGCHHLSKEDIASIKVVTNVEYITLETVKRGHFGSFQDILAKKYQALEEPPKLLLSKHHK